MFAIAVVEVVVVGVAVVVVVVDIGVAVVVVVVDIVVGTAVVVVVVVVAAIDPAYLLLRPLNVLHVFGLLLQLPAMACIRAKAAPIASCKTLRSPVPRLLS